MSVVSKPRTVSEYRHTGRRTLRWDWLWNSLGRATSSGRVIPAIDGLRSLAIVAVIMHHLGGYVAQRTPGLDVQQARYTLAYQVTNVGNCGVQLFFVISGFILSLPFAEQALRGDKRVQLGKYFIRRITRLHPPYVVNLALLSILLLVVKKESIHELGPHLLASLFYCHNLIYHSKSTINGVAWSLEIEMQYYLIAPAMAVVYRISNAFWRRGLIVALIAASIAWKVVAGPNVPVQVSTSVLYYMDYFWCGFLLADWKVLAPTNAGRFSSWWDVGGIVGLTGSLICALNQSSMPILPVMLVLLCGCALRGPRMNGFFSQPLLATIGAMCFTIYLYHFGVISLIGRATSPWMQGYSYPVALMLQAAIVLPSILIVSALLFVSIEKPFMTRRRLLPVSDPELQRI